MSLDVWARMTGGRRLAPLGRRWVHNQAVGQRAAEVGEALTLGSSDRELLVAAAYLHDVGYDPELAVTGFHPLDGARWLRNLGDERLASLVAHHSGAVGEAQLRGLAEDMRQFPNEGGIVTAALWYCDLTTGPGGESMTPRERLADVEARHGRASVVTEGLRLAWPALMEAVDLVEKQLAVAVVSQPR